MGRGLANPPVRAYTSFRSHRTPITFKATRRGREGRPMNRAILVDDAPAPIGAGAFLQAPAPRHLLGLEGVPRESLLVLLDRAAHYRERLRTPRWVSDELKGVAICNAFFEDSTRTRVSFELAEQRLGAIHTTFTISGSSISK